MISQLSALFSVHAAAAGIGAYFWMRLAWTHRTAHLLSTAGFLQCSMFALLYGGAMPKGLFLLIVALHGFAAGAVEPLYIGFNYLDKWGGGVQTAARRMGLVEPWRFAAQFLLTGVLATEIGSEGGVPPALVQGIFGGVTAACAVCSFLCLFVPINEKLRLPPIKVCVPSSSPIGYSVMGESGMVRRE